MSVVCPKNSLSQAVEIEQIHIKQTGNQLLILKDVNFFPYISEKTFFFFLSALF